MCTSLTLKTKNDYHFLGRTMDFSVDINKSVHLLPRNYKILNSVNNKYFKTKYALLGMSTILDSHPIFADGLNEYGLCCSALYFPGYAKYENSINKTKENLAPYDLVLWILCNFKNLEEVKTNIKNINIIDKPLSLLKLTPPLHWIVSDKSGNSIVIEKTKNGIDVLDNPIGVMTNSPNLNWHLTNLNQYISLNPNQYNNTKWENFNLSPFGQGSGTFGLPGDFTPPSRFVRCAFLKNNLTNLNCEIDGVNGIFQVLSSCNIPKGAVLKMDKSEDKTLYTAVMCSESLKYYYSTYNNRQITCIDLSNEDLNMKEIKSYPYRDTQSILFEN